jgi:putative oxidoreductase
VRPLLHPLKDHVHALLRIVAGYSFTLHGAQKLFAVLGSEEPVELLSLLGVAGAIEAGCGALIILGIFTPWVAFIASGQMAVAYFLGHVLRSGAFPFPLVNGGESAVLFCFIFLYFASTGAGVWSVDAWRSGAR